MQGHSRQSSYNEQKDYQIQKKPNQNRPKSANGQSRPYISEEGLPPVKTSQATSFSISEQKITDSIRKAMLTHSNSTRQSPPVSTPTEPNKVLLPVKD